jgi:predicted acetyltransferase
VTPTMIIAKTNSTKKPTTLASDHEAPPNSYGKVMGMFLIQPGAEHLPSYTDALRSGWSADTMRPLAATEELQRIEADPQAFLDGLDDRDGTGAPITLPDGSVVPRLPGFRRWMWDGEFCGSIGLRWQPGTTDLPPHCLGHIGYAVVPWKRNRCYATEALGQVLPLAALEGLPFVDVVTEPANVASQKVIQANGGVLVEEFVMTSSHGGGVGLRYRIALNEANRSDL